MVIYSFWNLWMDPSYLTRHRSKTLMMRMCTIKLFQARLETYLQWIVPMDSPIHPWMLYFRTIRLLRMKWINFCGSRMEKWKENEIPSCKFPFYIAYAQLIFRRLPGFVYLCTMLTKMFCFILILRKTFGEFCSLIWEFFFLFICILWFRKIWILLI